MPVSNCWIELVVLLVLVENVDQAGQALAGQLVPDILGGHLGIVDPL